jgi:hypothetical protein
VLAATPKFKLNAGQRRVLGALEGALLKGGDLARHAGYKQLDALARDVKPLIDAGMVQVSGPLQGDDIFYAVFGIRPSDVQSVRDTVRRASEE